MHGEPLASEVFRDSERAVNQHEDEEEDRQHNHVQNLWHEAAENL